MPARVRSGRCRASGSRARRRPPVSPKSAQSRIWWVFFASYLIGAIKDATGSYPVSLIPLMVLCIAGTAALIRQAGYAARTRAA
jgi:hypothetical protein